MASLRQRVLRSYRELLGLIRALPAARQEAAAAEARAAMRAHREEAAPERVLQLVAQLTARCEFLRATTPKHRQPRRAGSSDPALRFVLRDGHLVQGRGRSAGQRVADGSLTPNEAWEIHNRQMRRLNFGREPPKTKPFF